MAKLLVEVHLRCPSKNPKLNLAGFKPTLVRGKWFQANNLNHLATDAII
jgi:hypothetical protein